jgi:hypothetical protein
VHAFLDASPYRRGETMHRCPPCSSIPRPALGVRGGSSPYRMLRLQAPSLGHMTHSGCAGLPVTGARGYRSSRPPNGPSTSRAGFHPRNLYRLTRRCEAWTPSQRLLNSKKPGEGPRHESPDSNLTRRSGWRRGTRPTTPAGPMRNACGSYRARPDRGCSARRRRRSSLEDVADERSGALGIAEQGQRRVASATERSAD